VTDIAKAITFATHCLKWRDASTAENMRGTLICDGTPESIARFNPDSAQDLQAVLAEFLGRKYFIQINRGTTSLFHWCVIVGLQDMTVKGVSFDHAQAEGEDLWDTIFDACVQAAGMFEETENGGKKVF
jgi:hypothetical protein